MTAPALADRVKETTATTGTGTVTLAGASTGYRAFNGAITSGGSCYYCLESGTDWEVGIGTFTHGGSDTLSRDTVLASSAGGTTKITLAGTSNVFVTRPAAAIVPAASAADLPVVTHSGGATLAAADRGAVHQFNGSSASTVTYTAPATLGAGWWCIVENALTGTTGLNQTLTHTPASGNIDGVSSGATYPGSQLLVQCDGSNFNVVLLRGGFCQLVTGDSPFTYVTAIGAKRFFVEQWAGGGSGGSGNSGTAGGARAGGSGGGGGSHKSAWFKNTDLGASITCTIAAAQSTVGTAQTAHVGIVGTVGNNTTFGALLTAFGGGAGAPGLAASNSGGSGGGWQAAGATGGGSSQAGGGSSAAADGHFAGSASQGGGSGRPSAYGGSAGGGADPAGASGNGGTATKGGVGGGSGGSLQTGNGALGGGNGGSTSGALNGGGTSGGNAGTSGVAGGSPNAASLTPTALGPGLGGGGGGGGFGTTTVSAGGTGGDGGVAAGGGGGGASDSSIASGAGGKGGPGLIRVWDFP